MSIISKMISHITDFTHHWHLIQSHQCHYEHTITALSLPLSALLRRAHHSTTIPHDHVHAHPLSRGQTSTVKRRSFCNWGTIL